MAKKTADAKEIKKYSKESQDAINRIVAAERNKKLEEDTKKDKALVEEYYNLKDKLLEIISAAGKSKHKNNKRLKIIANLPARRPSTSKGYSTTAGRINKGTLSNTKKKSTEPLSVIVEEKEGKVEARKLAPRKKKAPANKKAPVKKAPAKTAPDK